MQLQRFVGLVDLGVLTVAVVTLVLPPREMYAGPAHKASEAEQFALALAEARTMARPDDGAAVDDLSRRLAAAGFADWAIEAAVHGSERAKQSPTRWRALRAASFEFANHNDATPALEYINRALSACQGQPSACPDHEQIRMQKYQEQLAAGVASGIDPHAGPAAVKAFQRAGEGALRQIRLGGHDGERGSATPAPAAGSSATGSTP